MSEPARTLSPQAQQLLAIIKDFRDYAKSCLKIMTKKGEMLPLVLNSAQVYLDDRINEQLARLGKVRLIILKGRQQGISTMVGGRFYWRASSQFGKRVMILTHLDEATQTLFEMVKTYNNNVPGAVKPASKNDNAKELSFGKLHSRYAVSTAGSKGTGRGGVAQYFHGSEVAFWPNAEKHMAGIGQIIPDAEGTEIILESTANGVGNLFHRMVQLAMLGKGDYELVFIPWFWQTEYTRLCPRDAEFSPDELEYQSVYKITDDQLYWRQMKIINDFTNDETLFDQEYPASIAMAFMAGTSKALIKPVVVSRAIANKDADDVARQALILGVDPAEYGDDDTAVVLRRGPKVISVWRFSGEGNAQIAGRVGLILDEYELKGDPIDAVAIDVTGIGTGVEAFLTDAKRRNIYRVHNGESAIQTEKYRNRGAEGWCLMRDWLMDATLPASLPGKVWIDGKLKDDTVLEAELSSRGHTYDSRRRAVLQSKEDMRQKGIRSPNTADALALTFNVSVSPQRKKQVETLASRLRRLNTRHHRGGSPGMSA